MASTRRIAKCGRPKPIRSVASLGANIKPDGATMHSRSCRNIFVPAPPRRSALANQVRHPSSFPAALRTASIRSLLAASHTDLESVVRFGAETIASALPNQMPLVPPQSATALSALERTTVKGLRISGGSASLRGSSAECSNHNLEPRIDLRGELIAAVLPGQNPVRPARVVEGRCGSTRQDD